MYYTTNTIQIEIKGVFYSILNNLYFTISNDIFNDGFMLMITEGCLQFMGQ